MTIFQFAISGYNAEIAGALPLRSLIVHPFSGKRIKMKLLTLQFRQTEQPSVGGEPAIDKLATKYPLRLDLVRGFTTDAGTAFDPVYNPLALKANSSQLGFLISNDDCDLHMNDTEYIGFCTGNVWELQLNIAAYPPGYIGDAPDVGTIVDTLILTVDAKEI